MKHRSTTGDYRFGQNKERLVNWLHEMGYKRVAEELPRNGWVWILAVTDHQDRSVLLLQESNKPNRIFIQGGVAIVEPQKSALASLSPLAHEAFELELATILTQFQVDFVGVQRPMEAVDVTHYIYTDGLKQDSLYQRIERVRCAVLAARWVIERRCLNERPQTLSFTIPGEPPARDEIM